MKNRSSKIYFDKNFILIKTHSILLKTKNSQTNNSKSLSVQLKKFIGFVFRQKHGLKTKVFFYGHKAWQNIWPLR